MHMIFFSYMCWHRITFLKGWTVRNFFLLSPCIHPFLCFTDRKKETGNIISELYSNRFKVQQSLKLFAFFFLWDLQVLVPCKYKVVVWLTIIVTATFLTDRRRHREINFVPLDGYRFDRGNIIMRKNKDHQKEYVTIVSSFLTICLQLVT